MNDKKKELTYKSLLKIVVIGVLLYCGIQKYKIVFGILARALDVIFPFILGGIIAFVINVPMRKIESFLFPQKENLGTLRRVLAYIITLALIIGVITLALLVIIPQISSTVNMIIDRVPGAFAEFQKKLYKATENMPDIQAYIEEMNINWGSLSSDAIRIIKAVSTTLFSSGFGIVSSVLGGITTFLVAFIFSIYVLFQKEKLGVQGKKVLYALFKEDKADRIVYVCGLAQKIFSNFLSGQCIEACILGTMFFITLSIFRIHYAVLVGVIIAITALIPIFGAFIGMGISAFLIVMVSPTQALWFIIIFFVLQQIENNLIYPYVVGGSIGLPSIWVLVAVMVGGDLFGIAGILVFIPFCSVCYTLFRDFVKKRLREREIKSEKWEDVMEIEIEDESQSKKNKNIKTTAKTNVEINKQANDGKDDNK